MHGLRLAPALDRVAKASRPVIWLLSRSTDVVVRVFGIDPGAAREAISEEELRDIVAGSEFSACRFSANHASNYLPITADLPEHKRALVELARDAGAGGGVLPAGRHSGRLRVNCPP